MEFLRQFPRVWQDDGNGVSTIWMLNVSLLAWWLGSFRWCLLSHADHHCVTFPEGTSFDYGTVFSDGFDLYMECLMLSILYYQLFCFALEFCTFTFITEIQSTAWRCLLSLFQCLAMCFKRETSATKLFHVEYLADLLVQRTEMLTLVFLDIITGLISWSFSVSTSSY